MNTKGETCLTCRFFAHSRLYKSDLESFDTVDHCRRYPEHVGIAEAENHWCGEYITDANIDAGETAKRILKSRESRDRRRESINPY